MDLTDTIAPKSDQLDAVDLLSGARVFTITGASKGSSEQPVNIALAEFPRPWRPGKSMRRVLVALWGPDASKYVGRRVELYCEPDVIFGGVQVGGTRIRAMSHIDGPKSVPLIVSRGKSAVWTVEPLPDAPAPSPARHRPSPAEVAACTDVATLQGWRDETSPRLCAAIDARIKALFESDEEPDPTEEPMTADEEQGELIP